MSTRPGVVLLRAAEHVVAFNVDAVIQTADNAVAATASMSTVGVEARLVKTYSRCAAVSDVRHNTAANEAGESCARRCRGRRTPSEKRPELFAARGRYSAGGTAPDRSWCGVAAACGRLAQRRPSAISQRAQVRAAIRPLLDGPPWLPRW